MADLNKKTMMTNEQMEAKLNSLHSKETKWKVLAICAFVMMFVIGFITGNVLLVLAFLVIMIVFSFFWGLRAIMRRKVSLARMSSTVC